MLIGAGAAGRVITREIAAKVAQLREAVDGGSSQAELVSLLKAMVPTFCDPNEVNARASENIRADRETRATAGAGSASPEWRSESGAVVR